MRCCLKSLFNLLLGVVVLAALGLAALYFWAYPRLDQLFSDSVRREFMLPPSSTVTLTHGDPLQTFRGQVPHMLVEASEAKIEGLVVEDVKLEAKNVSFDLPATIVTGDAKWQGVESAQLKFKVSEDSLKQRWTGELEQHGLKKPEVKLHDGKVDITGLLDASLFKLRVGASGRIQVDGTDRVVFKPDNLELGGTSFGVEQVGAIFSALTPVIDLGDLKLGVGVDKMEPHDGYLFVVARTIKAGGLHGAQAESATVEPGGNEEGSAAGTAAAEKDTK